MKGGDIVTDAEIRAEIRRMEAELDRLYSEEWDDAVEQAGEEDYLVSKIEDLKSQLQDPFFWD